MRRLDDGVGDGRPFMTIITSDCGNGIVSMVYFAPVP